ncbi:MAG: TetR family transcriptional regulator [Spirochaetes bacterium]|jgi:AcrR family transcriptional regulator|nr:TetR family transcriptional regulator [Spirochaetota bacterium]
MPKETFFNLPEEKRSAFLAAAFREFALHDYDTASISRIVAELGIAKGSLYQYFEDKRDLYAYLLERAAAEKLDYLANALGSGGETGGETADETADEADFFYLQARMLIAGARFDLSHPDRSLILYRAMQEPADANRTSVAEELTQQSAEFIRGYLSAAAERGEIRTDVEIDLAAHVVNTVTLSLEPYLKMKYGYSHLQQLVDDRENLPFTEQQLEDDIHSLVRVMRSGLQSQGK